MEDGLVLICLIGLKSLFIVLILIVVEDGLVHQLADGSKAVTKVLILIVVEDGLVLETDAKSPRRR